MEERDHAEGKDYKRLRNRVVSLAKRDRLQSNLTKLQQAGSNPKLLWKLAGDALGKQRDALPPFLMVNGVPAKGKFEFLGVKFDTNFTTSPHDNNVARAARRRAGLVARLGHHLPRGEFLRRLAGGLIMGKVGYAAAVTVPPRLAGDNAPQSNAHKATQVAINDVAGTITGKSRKEHLRIPDLLHLAKIPSVNELAIKAIVLETWKAFHSSDGRNGLRNPIGQIIFPPLHLRNNPCVGNDGKNGTWYSLDECEKKRGRNGGSCASGFGQCCVCNALDVDQASASQCLADSFSATNPGGSLPPTICGMNTGEHMYLNASECCNDLTFMLGSEGIEGSLVNRQWSIKITQYSCDYENLAPKGCTQYFFNTDGVDTVQTYNFQGGPHLASQNQNICVRKCWTTSQDEDFDVSGTSGAVPMTLEGIHGPLQASACCNYGSFGMGALGYDCLSIPGALTAKGPSSQNAPSRICGGMIGIATTSGGPRMTICSRRTPFNIRFFSDRFEIAGETAEAFLKNRGFKLTYNQTGDGC
eukprot:maker-scaffold68_size422247-snap-gene-3.22 protein:Tk11402 transcript:maker-scaffold68_size422247-snap-gene-3.22-mRNA-1 annotation:"PREDICTED: uncharacterized protein LOC100161421"